MALGDNYGDPGDIRGLRSIKDTDFTMSYDLREDLRHVFTLIDNVNTDDEVVDMRAILEDAERQIGGMGSPIVEDYENLNEDYGVESFNMRLSEQAANKIQNIVEEEFREETGMEDRISVEQVLAPNRAIINIYDN